MQKKRSFSFFGIAHFFIRNMKFHERISLMALTLFIPLLTFSFLFISSKQHDAELLVSEIHVSQANIQLLRLIQTLQYKRGSQKHAIYTSGLEKMLFSKQLQQSITEHLNTPRTKKLLFQWNTIQKEIQNFFGRHDLNEIEHFTSLSHIIAKIRLLMGFSLEFSNTDYEQESYIEKALLFEHLPNLVESLAILRGSLSSVLFKKELIPEFTPFILKNYYAQKEQRAEIDYQLTLNHNRFQKLFNKNDLTPFDKVFKEIQHLNFNRNSKEFFVQASTEINLLYQFLDTVAKENLISLNNSYYLIQRNNFYLYLLLIVSLFLAFYFFTAIYLLVRRKLQEIKNTAVKLAELKVAEPLIIDGKDEYFEIATSLNKLANMLKFDSELINHYIPLSRTNIKGIITEVNDAFCQLTGYKPEELIGKHHNILHQNKDDKVFQELYPVVLSGKAWDVKLLDAHKDGSNIWVQLHIIPSFNEQKELTGFTSLRRNITERKKALQLSITDDLTKLYNRKFFNDALESEIDKSKRYDYIFSLIMIDIDHFKKINDTYGHQQGDEILKKFSGLISKMLRSSDIFARWGGEEFMILLPYTELKKAYSVADSLRVTIENFCTNANKSTTISLGVTSFHPSSDEKGDLLLRCDNNLYKAKDLGRNRVVSS